MSTPQGIPAGTPFVSTDDYAVRVRLLSGLRGTLLIETEAEIRARYAEAEADARIQYAAQPDTELTEPLARLAEAMRQEIDLFAQVEAARGADIAASTFTFRVPTIADHEAAEAEAGRTVPRQELVYRRVLAQRTLRQTDCVGFTDFLALRTDVALYVLRQVAGRVTMAQDVRSFLSGSVASLGPD